MRHKSYCTSPLGRLTLLETDGALSAVHLSTRFDPAEIIVKDTALFQETAHQLDEYFRHRRQAFSLPLKPERTPFQQRVWNVLLEIPYGETRSYRQIAQQAGNSKACRAVGGASGREQLGGYSGGLSIKIALLELECACR